MLFVILSLFCYSDGPWWENDLDGLKSQESLIVLDEVYAGPVAR